MDNFDDHILNGINNQLLRYETDHDSRDLNEES
jgi:hypothetical protein